MTSQNGSLPTPVISDDDAATRGLLAGRDLQVCDTTLLAAKADRPAVS
jgi:hypothetical protein